MPLDSIRRALRVLIRPNERLLLGVSGGADSMALLHATVAGTAGTGISLRAVHVHHGLRGRAADADARHVLEVCRSLRIPCTIVRRRVAAAAERSGRSIEMEARAARHTAFRSVAQRTRATAVVLAHTADDQAEGILLRLLRGAGLEGLGGMTPAGAVSGLRVLRPFLKLRHDDCVAFLREAGLAWREDASNRDPAMLRNRVRHELLPLLERDFNPAIREVLSRTATTLREDAAYLESRADAEFQRLETGRLPMRVARLPDAVRHRVVLRWLREHVRIAEPRLDRALVLSVDDILGGAVRQINLPGGRRLQRTQHAIVLEAMPRMRAVSGRFSVSLPGRTDIPALGIRVVARQSRGWRPAASHGLGRLPATCFIPRETATLVFRARRSGDMMAPVGLAGRVSLQDLFVNAKIPRSDRGRVPVLVAGREIVWIPGYRISRNHAVAGPGAASWRIEVTPLPESART